MHRGALCVADTDSSSQHNIKFPSQRRWRSLLSSVASRMLPRRSILVRVRVVHDRAHHLAPWGQLGCEISCTIYLFPISKGFSWAPSASRSTRTRKHRHTHTHATARGRNQYLPPGEEMLVGRTVGRPGLEESGVLYACPLEIAQKPGCVCPSGVFSIPPNTDPCTTLPRLPYCLRLLRW